MSPSNSYGRGTAGSSRFFIAAGTGCDSEGKEAGIVVVGQFQGGDLKPPNTNQ